MDEYQFPLFVTSRQLILMLDASLPAPHFFERNDDGCLVDTSPELTTPVLDLDNESDDDTDDGLLKKMERERESSTMNKYERFVRSQSCLPHVGQTLSQKKICFL